MSNIRFEGVMPPMITPFRSNGQIDLDAFVRNIQRWNEQNLGGYVVLGSNSETPYLSTREKINLIGKTVEYSARGRAVIAGTGLESTRATLDFTNRAAALGAHAVLVITPAFYSDRMDAEVLLNHYSTIADGSDIPIILYNVPKYTHVSIPVDVVGTLSKHPNIVGMKDSSGDLSRLATCQKMVDTEFQLIAGTASIWLPALMLGITTGILALANCAPDACIRVKHLYCEKKFSEARDLYLSLVPVNSAVTATYGIAGLKYAMNLLGYEGGRVRKPLRDLHEIEKERIKNLLTESGLLHTR